MKMAKRNGMPIHIRGHQFSNRFHEVEPEDHGAFLKALASGVSLEYEAHMRKVRRTCMTGATLRNQSSNRLKMPFPVVHGGSPISGMFDCR